MTIDVETTFLEDVKNHEMEILSDVGNHRHLRFSKNKSSSYHFDIVTWDGYLTISGDMGCTVFSRLQDMFVFFRADSNRLIDYRYWQEKVVSGRESTEKFSYRKFRKNIDDYIESRLNGEGWTEQDIDALYYELRHCIGETMHEFELYTAVRDFDFTLGSGHRKDSFNFNDFWEYNSNEYTFHFIWQCNAIQYAINEYDKFKEKNES